MPPQYLGQVNYTGDLTPREILPVAPELRERAHMQNHQSIAATLFLSPYTVSLAFFLSLFLCLLSVQMPLAPVTVSSPDGTEAIMTMHNAKPQSMQEQKNKNPM